MALVIPPKKFTLRNGGVSSVADQTLDGASFHPTASLTPAHFIPELQNQEGWERGLRISGKWVRGKLL